MSTPKRNFGVVGTFAARPVRPGRGELAALAPPTHSEQRGLGGMDRMQCMGSPRGLGREPGNRAS